MSDKLAIHGGTPVRQSVLPYGHQSLTEADIAAVVDVLRGDWITTGPKVAEFERALAEYVGAKRAVAFSSGTAALHAAAFAAALRPGDEAITAPLTFCATANAVLYQGATPVFADVEPETLTIDVADAERRITAKTRALLPIDYAGHPADASALRALADRHGLVIIEDAAHALGAEHGGRRLGSIADMTMFSFHPVKHLTTGEGGAITTDSDALAGRLEAFRNHGIESDPRTRQAQGQWHYDMTSLGYNYRLTDIGCALGLSQIPRLDANLSRRRAIADRYLAELGGVPGLRLPAVASHARHAWHLFPVRIDPSRNRGEVFRALRAEGIGVNVHYLPVHLHTYYRQRFGYRGGEYPVTEAASEQLISLPMFHGMSDNDVADVVTATMKVMTYFAAAIVR